MLDCVMYRHKETPPVDAAPFIEIYKEGQEPDTFAKASLEEMLPFRAQLLETAADRKLSLEHQICLAAASDTCGRLAPTGGKGGVATLQPNPEPHPWSRGLDAGTLQPFLPGEDGPLQQERAPTYLNLGPRTTWEDEHPIGFWRDVACVLRP